jgi:2-polyprenyl-3-methyl-5-hydroxy-6-metoxy-1,4-benzoquinol methylase
MDPVTARVKAHFDAIGEVEWDRLTVHPRDRVSFELHRRLLAECIRPGDRVLEVGSGPGRFTIELGRLGARVTVTDLSEVKLALNEAHVREAGLENCVDARFVLDVRDIGELGDGAFDVVVAFGGPLSYVFDEAPAAFRQLVRAVVPGGVVVASVMSMAGAARYFFAQVVEELEVYGIDAWQHIMTTGDLREIGRDVPNSHTCQLFRWREIEDMISATPCMLVAASASNCMSLGDDDALGRLETDPDRWAWFLDWETAMCREPGALDGGTHTLFAVRRDR